jgi:hypothetical protein
MPTATDLVTDLPADFEVFGQAVATSMADLLGGPSGYILSKNSATDMDFVWIANDQGDITGITATTPLTGGGSSGAITVGIQDALTTQKGAVQLSDSTSTTSSVLAATPTAVKSAYDLAAAAIPKSTVTTNGDLIYGTGSSTVSRIGVGSAGQVLTVTAGIPAWATPAAAASGLTFISKTDFTTSSTVNINSVFTSTYTNYYIVMNSVSTTVTQGDISFRLRASGTDTTTNYKSQRLYASGTSVGAGIDVLGTDEIWFSSGSATGSAPQGTSFILMSPNEAKSTTMQGSVAVDIGSGTTTMDIVSGFQSSATQFDGITFLFSQTSTGSIYIYGLAKA